MTRAELNDFVEHKLGSLSNIVRARQLGVLADRLRPGEQLVTVALASRRLRFCSELLVAATDRRLLVIPRSWISRSSTCEAFEDEALISVSHDAARCEITLVTRPAVCTLMLAPAVRAPEIVTALAARIGNDRLHQPSRTPEATAVPQERKKRPKWRWLLAVGLNATLAVAVLHALLPSHAPNPTRQFERMTETFNHRAQVAADSDQYTLALAAAAALSTDQEAAIRRRIANRIAERVVIAVNAHDLQRARSLLHLADRYTNTPLLTRARSSYLAAKR